MSQYLDWKATTPTTAAPDAVEKKTADAVKAPIKIFNPLVEQSGAVNILNKYKSYSYVFTLAALEKSLLATPDAYRTNSFQNSANNLVILKSGGKGSAGIQSGLTTNTITVDDVPVYDKNDAAVANDINKKRRIDSLKETQDLISEFNKNSPGRFDMFIENVEIETIMAFNAIGGTTQPTNISFDVIEPYSINGFIEALHIASVAAGYSSYTQASFILKVEFLGYPDGQDITSSELVPQSTRYFILGFTGLEVEITERGMKYRCSAVPFEQRAFGQSNTIKQPINMSGSKVKSILENFMITLNEQIKDSDAQSKSSDAAKHSDEYAIKFPSWSDTNGLDYKIDNKIANADITNLNKDSSLFKFSDPGLKDQAGPPMSSANEILMAAGQTVQFTTGARIHESIAAVIRDSTYIRGILADLSGTTTGTASTDHPAELDSYGMLNYFLIRLEVTNESTIDTVSRKPFQKFTYIVTPYRIHYTRIPNYGDLKIDAEKLKTLSLREYNYIYTGKNIDITNFKLNFNSLYFEALPRSMGNNNFVSSKNAIAPAGNVDTKSKDGNVERMQQNTLGTPATKSDESANYVSPEAGGTGGQRQDTPYSVLARNMHEAVINSNVSMVTGELDIIGDPFYLVTGGIGNYNPKPAGRGLTVDGESAFNTGDTMITINFRNPDDINSFENGGMMRFNANKVPFSGIYRVNSAVSMFQDGQFKQQLKIMRLPGQIIGDTSPISNVQDQFTTSAKSIDQSSPDTTTADNPSARPSSANALLQLTRGIVSPGLPGVLSNFTAAVGGIGSSVNSLLNQVSGAVSGGINQLTSAASTLGGIVPGGVDQLASGIRLQASGLINSVQNQTASTIGGLTSITGAANSAIGKVTNVASVANFAADIQNKISAITSGIPTDPFAIASKFGINAAQLSGLSADLQSKVLAQAAALNKLIPTNVDISRAIDQGIVLNYIPSGKLANLPATAPLVTAPAAAVDTQFLNRLVKEGGQQALANAYGVSDISKISSSLLSPSLTSGILSSIPASISNPLAGSLSAINGVASIGNSLSSGLSSLAGSASAINNVQNLATSVTSQFGSISKAASPLTSLISKIG
jgi:hypothetical protein